MAAKINGKQPAGEKKKKGKKVPGERGRRVSKGLCVTAG